MQKRSDDERLIAYLDGEADVSERREIETWPQRAATIFYCAVGLLVLDLGLYAVVGVNGRDALAFIVVAAICVYIGVRTWRQQRHYV